MPSCSNAGSCFQLAELVDVDVMTSWDRRDAARKYGEGSSVLFLSSAASNEVPFKNEGGTFGECRPWTGTQPLCLSLSLLSSLHPPCFSLRQNYNWKATFQVTLTLRQQVNNCLRISKKCFIWFSSNHLFHHFEINIQVKRHQNKVFKTKIHHLLMIEKWTCQNILLLLHVMTFQSILSHQKSVRIFGIKQFQTTLQAMIQCINIAFVHTST